LRQRSAIINRLLQKRSEVALKALFLLLVFVLSSSSLHAESPSIYTDLEQLQEKIWYLQRDVEQLKISIEDQQKQLNGLDTDIKTELTLLNERFSALHQDTATREEKTGRMESGLDNLGEVLTGLITEVKQQNDIILEQAEKINALEKSMAAIRAERMSQRTDTGQELSAFREQLSEVHSQLDTIEQGMHRQLKQLSYWAAGAALFFSVVLTFVVLLLKNRRSSH
jgi:chromosome segregation ATPase